MVDAVDILGALVRIPSLNPMGRDDLTDDPRTGEVRLTAWLEAFFGNLGVRYERDEVLPGRDNLIAWYDAPRPRGTLLFDAHQDTVPVDGMTISPFEPRVESGRLYGRGSCDVKAGMAAMLAAFARLARERPADSANVVMACTVDEEYTHRGSSRLASNLPAKRIDLAVVAEPTDLRVITSHKGAVRWRIVARGRACHSSDPGAGDNAIYRMARVVTVLREEASRLGESVQSHDPDWTATLSVGKIHGGTAANIVPDSCVIEVDRRVIPGESPETARLRVIQAVLDALPDDRDHLEFQEPWVAMPALSDNVPKETLRTIVDVVGRVRGSLPRIGRVPFGTDAGPLAQAGVPCIVLGPGQIQQAHTSDEWVEIEQVRAAAEVFFGLALALNA